MIEEVRMAVVELDLTLDVEDFGIEVDVVGREAEDFNSPRSPTALTPRWPNRSTTLAGRCRDGDRRCREGGHGDDQPAVAAALPITCGLHRVAVVGEQSVSIERRSGSSSTRSSRVDVTDHIVTLRRADG
jgi:hypothetical protein